jgi:glycine oxidase
MGPDVIVAGGGIIGSAIAWRLSQQGARVTVFDPYSDPGRASTAAAGMLAPGGEIECESEWAAAALESHRLYPEFVQELAAVSGRRIDYRVAGAVEVASSDAGWEELTLRADRQSRLGIESKPLTIGEIKEFVPGQESARALYFPGDAVVSPTDLLDALRTLPIAREHTRIRHIAFGRGHVRLSTDEGSFQASAAVLACGAWSSEVAVEGSRLPAAIPVKGHLVGYDLPPGAFRTIVRSAGTYCFQRGSGFTIAGSSTERVAFDATVNPEIVAGIDRRARALLGELLPADPVRAWIGFRPGVEADQPAVGRWRDTRLWLAYGHYRNGILLAPITANRIAAEIRSSLGTG